MAIDTAAKRYSAINPGNPWRGVFPLPDGTISAQDRANIVWLYNGITFGGASDTTPDAFSFTDQSGVALSATITSATETLTGTDAASPISVAGDASSEYQYNGGAWTSAPGNIPAGATYAVRHTSSASYLTAVNTILTIGGVSDTFTSTTLGDPALAANIYGPFSFSWWRF